MGQAILNVVEPDAIVQALSIIGLSFLLFLSGLEIDIQRLRGPQVRLVGIGLAGTIVLAVVVGWLLNVIGLVESPLLVGIALVATSLGLLVPILKDAGTVGRPVGQLTIGAGTSTSWTGGAHGSSADHDVLTVRLSASPPTLRAQTRALPPFRGRCGDPNMPPQTR